MAQPVSIRSGHYCTGYRDFWGSNFELSGKWGRLRLGKIPCLFL